MDKATIKLVLSAWRQDRRDADDPIFAEALRESAHDPELVGWFEEEQRFDALMVGTFQRVPTPAGLKDVLLLNAKSPGKAPGPAAAGSKPDFPLWNRQVRTWLAMAACVVLAFVLGRQTRAPVGAPAAESLAIDNGGALGLQAIAYTSKLPALQFVCFDAGAVANWVDRKSAAMDMGKVIGKPLESMQMIGSSTARWNGKPVVMIALQNGERMAMLYLVRASDFPGAAGDAGRIMEKDGWVSKTGRNGEHLYVLTAKGTRENLDFPMPL